MLWSLIHYQCHNDTNKISRLLNVYFSTKLNISYKLLYFKYCSEPSAKLEGFIRISILFKIIKKTGQKWNHNNNYNSPITESYILAQVLQAHTFFKSLPVEQLGRLHINSVLLMVSCILVEIMYLVFGSIYLYILLLGLNVSSTLDGDRCNIYRNTQID
jgi:hypothetical protein